jgi:hypothetical protein
MGGSASFNTCSTGLANCGTCTGGHANCGTRMGDSANCGTCTGGYANCGTRMGDTRWACAASGKRQTSIRVTFILNAARSTDNQRKLRLFS